MIEQMDIPKILKTALKNGGDFAELFEEYSLTTHIMRERQRFEKLSYGRDNGVGLRVMFEDKTVYGYTNEIFESSLLELAEQIASAVRAKFFHLDIALRPQAASWEKHVEIEPSAVPMDYKIALVTKADRYTWGLSPLLKQVTTSYRDHERQIRIANSRGEWAEEKQIYLVFVSQVVASEGEQTQSAYEPMGGTSGFESLGETEVLEVAKTAADRALLMLKAPLAPSGPMMVVLSSEAGGTMVHEAVGHGLEADLAREGLSVYQNKIGERVANPLITVMDDPTLPGKRGSFLFDDEGTPAKRNVLIDRGILKSYMYDRRYASRDHVLSTGNGRRESYRNRPIVRMTNTLIAPGDSDPAAVLRSADRGLLVKRMGGGQVNTVNGEFVFEVSEGYLIKNGKIDRPVRGATLTGNGPDILSRIDMVGNDLGFGMGTCGKDSQGVPVGDAQPTLRIPEITVGGQGSLSTQE